MPKRTILCDIDGVVADFTSAAIEACCLPLEPTEVDQWDFYAPHISKSQFQYRIENKADFWESLKPYPWAWELVSMLKGYGDVVFCSSPGLWNESASAKLEWLQRYGFRKPWQDNFILTNRKELCATGNAILVDDCDENISAFRAAGGAAVTFPQKWNSEGPFSSCSLNLASVCHDLERLIQ